MVQNHYSSQVVFHVFHVLVPIGTKSMAFTHAHLLSKQNSPILSCRVIEFDLFPFIYFFYLQFPASNYRYMNMPFVADP